MLHKKQSKNVGNHQVTVFWATIFRHFYCMFRHSCNYFKPYIILLKLHVSIILINSCNSHDYVTSIINIYDFNKGYKFN